MTLNKNKVKKFSHRGRRPAELPRDRDILLLLPEYGEAGDTVHIYLKDGSEKTYSLSMDGVLKGLARRRCKDLGLVRRSMEEITHERANNPLPISAELVLSAFRARNPRVPGDTVLGYVNVASTVRLRAEPLEEASGREARNSLKGSAILRAEGEPLLPRRARTCLKAQRLQRRGRRQAVLLVGTRSVPTLWTLETVEKHLFSARMLHEAMLREATETVLRFQVES